MKVLNRSILPLIFVVKSILLLSITSLYPQNSYPEFEHLSVEQGLTQSIVNCIIHDNKGYLWFGTNDGLNRYDGYTFKTFRNIPGNSNSISDNFITSLAEDLEGNIWIGTTSGYLNKYDPHTGKFTHYRIQMHPLFADTRRVLTDIPPYYANYNNSTITSIYCDDQGVIWAGSFGSGLFRFDPYEETFNHFFYSVDENSVSSNYILSICGDKKGSIWIGAFTGGLNKLTRTVNNNNEESYKFINYINQVGRNTFPCRRITSVLFYKDALWIGAFGDGLYKLVTSEYGDTSFSLIKFNDLKRSSIVNTNITRLAPDNDGNLWIGTFGGGLKKYNPKTGKLTVFEHDPLNINSIDDNEVISLAIDKSGLIWAGTSSGFGVNKLNPVKTRFIQYRSEPNKINTLSDNRITSFAEDKDNNIWIGTYKGGLNKFSVEKKTFRIFTPNQTVGRISSNYITSLLIDRNNKIWLGMYNNGLIIFDPANNKSKHFQYNGDEYRNISSNQVTSIIEDKDGAIWIGTTNGGLDRIVFDKNYRLEFTNFKSSEVFPATIPNNNIIELFKGRKGDLWFTTRGSYLCRYNYDNENFTTYKLSENPLTNIMCIYEDSYDYMWLGTNNIGLVKFDKRTGKFIKFKNPYGLAGKTICGILPDKNNNLWLSTTFGLLKYNIPSNSVTSYNLNDGLQSLQFTGNACLLSKKGEMYFGGNNGFNYFNPDSIITYSSRPSIIITSIKASNKEFPVNGSTFYLSSSENYFSIEFTSLDFTDPSKNQYLYTLDGYEKKWNFSTGRNHLAEYNDLPPGKYTFKLKGSNSAGIWNNNPVELTIVITGPFWKSWWFILIFVLILTGIAAYMISLRVFQYLAVEKLKTKLSADLHDSVGSGLTEIAMLCEITKMDLKKESEASKQKLQMIAERSRSLIDNMSDIVWLVNPKPNTLYDLVLRLKDIYSPILSSLGISFKVEIPESLSSFKISMEKRQNIYLIFKEAINNSIKYSNAKEIRFIVKAENDLYQIILKDNGCGFNVSKANTGNGLTNIKNRAGSLNAEYIIDSFQGKGTIITLKGKN